MNRTIKGLILFGLVLILIMGSADASVLATASIDKKVIGENEVAALTVKLTNDSNIEVKNINLRIKSDSAIALTSELSGQQEITKTIESIKQGEVKVFVFKIKCVSTKSSTANVYAYYGTGTELTTAAATVVETITSPVSAVITSKNVPKDLGEEFTIDFKLTNKSAIIIKKVSAEVMAPKGYEIKTPPIFQETIQPDSSVQQKFIITSPPEAVGEQSILVAYGYFDNNTPHYFEKEFTYNIQKTNYQMLGIIGIIILIIAAYLFTRKGKESDIKGTEEKKK
ncbi:MAG: hypothetical protein NTY48_03035 [Candidatus Diapherotrites archaeon]|nr:hypothetical protein [Candidatus Diapherotrites archaeon]